ncbi:MAG: ABC transporter substrate-binding protein, partial [Rhodocyclales bacterium]|nr:ABC transporter substrate-binding protein [Rhodocyclales bacterium]
MRALLIALGLLLALPASALEQVTLQLKWKHQFQFAGFYAAQEKGYYRDAGLDVRINEAHGNENPIETVLSGHADFGIGASELVLARGQGKPVVALATLIQHSPLTLLARHGIDTVQSLAGKRVMLVPHEIEMYAYFKREGLHPNAFEAISPSFDARDLIEGRVDAISGYSTDEPFELRNAGFRFTQMSPRAAGIDFYGDTLFTSEAQIGRHARRVAAFRDASLAGWHYAMAHPEEIADLIRAKYSQRNSRAHLLFEAEELRRLMQTDLVAIGHMYPGRWQHIADTYVELGMLPAGVSIDGLIWNPAPARLPDWVWLAFAAGALFLFLAGTAVWHYMRMAGRLGREIAERRIADQELQATRRNIAALLDATQSFAALLDLNGDILSINTHGAARFGGTCDEIVGRNIYELS